ncbi:hypothetical protein NV115_003012 [Vibrio alginolyticus]|nr:hypothetical protein [Vibrio alginolyticus]ELK2079351.1 hypothetical protein [Vibrio alginolyticus]
MLYKFVENQFMESFFNSGNLRLGTILDFNDVVKHGTARGDSKEGQHIVFRSVREVKLKEGKQEPLVSELFHVTGDREIIMENFSVAAQRRCNNGFLFCTSNEYTDSLFRRWNSEVKADACYQILNPRGFYYEISKVIRNSISEYRCKNVVYTKDPIPYDSPHAQENPAFTKEESEFSWQKENRCVWNPLLPPIKLKPWIIEVPEARKYCRPFKLWNSGSIKDHPVILDTV